MAGTLSFQEEEDIVSRPHRTPHPMMCLPALLFPLASIAAGPGTPGDVRYEVYSDTAAELFWKRTTDFPARGYELTRNGEDLGLFDALSYFDDTLDRGVDYTYTVTAVGRFGERSGTSTITLRTPREQDTIASLQRRIDSLEREIDALESRPTDGYPSPVPKTGQTESVKSGDDGDLQAGVPWPDPRLTLGVTEAEDSNGDGVCDGAETCDGTVTDNLTGLVWLQNANCFGERAWSDAIDDANLLAGDGSSSCGLSDGSEVGDWRLPNIKEIQSLLDYGHGFPEPLLPTNHPFVDVQIGGIDDRPSSYWTSTSIGPGSDGAYSVSVSVGWVERLTTGPGSQFALYVWPVRDAR